MHYVESIREEPLKFLYFDYNFYHTQIHTCRFRRWLFGAIRCLNSCVSLVSVSQLLRFVTLLAYFHGKYSVPLGTHPTHFQAFFAHALKLFQERNFVFFPRLLAVVPFTQIYSWWKLFPTITFLIYQHDHMMQKKNHTLKTEREREKIPREYFGKSF